MKRLALILILVVLLPALFYSGYELSSLSTNEQLMTSIYRQQLDVILFSINQYAWDVVNNWASNINILVNEEDAKSKKSENAGFSDFLRRNRAIEALIISDTGIQHAQYYVSHDTSSGVRLDESVIVDNLKPDSDKVHRLIQLQREQYRKIEPVKFRMQNGQEKLALLFVTSWLQGDEKLAAIVLDEQTFISQVLANKLREAAGNESVLAVVRNGTDTTIFTTSPVDPAKLRQTKDLWVFPDYSIGIGLKGETVEELVQSRFYRNLSLIVVLDIVLILGAWMIYRNMKREVELVKMKSDFVSNVSHELRTPLSLIRMFAETLQMGRIKKDEKRQEYYDTILSESERLTRLVNNVLNFSKMQAGKKEYLFEEVNLNDIVSSVLGTFRFHLQSEGFAPQIDLDKNLPTIYADREALAQAVMNLTDNAIKYSNKQKYLRVATGIEGNKVFVSVEDHGIGIPPGERQKIFDTFYRVSAGLVHNVKGSGLGLTLVKNIVDAHSGMIVLESEPGKGSTFRLEFPQMKKTELPP
ncbi:MAG TPA: HAMP domain-containing sensor histidine kinase [Bacteroidota bacterium]|nr:HAMP domain-containing sensor histidine kinase [Bacteroidota bacterium]